MTFLKIYINNLHVQISDFITNIIETPNKQEKLYLIFITK